MKLNKIVTLMGIVGALSGAGMVQANEAKFDRFTYQGIPESQAGPGQYINPVIPGYYPDPSVVRVGEDYYLVNSSFAYFPGLPVFHSRDLVNWQQIGNAFDRNEQFNLTNTGSSRGIFAPDISYHDGLFYIVSTCVQCGETFFNNFVMTAEDPQGPWSEPVSLDFAGIDPALFWDDDGKAYIIHNDEPEGGALYDGHKAIWLQEFDSDTLKVTGERVQIVNGGVDLEKKPFWVEGPHIFKKEGQYYLIAAEGGTESNHSEVVFKADTVKGQYEPYSKNPILTQRTLPDDRKKPVANTGHADIVQTQNGEWWSVFLGVRPYDEEGNFNIGRETFLLPVQWENGWPVILENGKEVPLVADKPDISHQESTGSDFSAYTDEFNADKLGLRWVSLRNAKEPLYRLEDGALLLESGGKLGDQSQVPAFVGVRQQHKEATITTRLEFTPEQDGDQAGLAAIQSDQSLLFYGVERVNGKNLLLVSNRDKSEEDILVKSVPFSGDKLDLSIHINKGKMTFSYSVEGQEQTLLADFDARFLSTIKAGGFVGTVVGPYSYQNK